jgi:hypothetical protein
MHTLKSLPGRSQEVLALGASKTWPSQSPGCDGHFLLGIQMEIKPNQIWRKNREPARVVSVSGDQIEMHFFERGPPTMPNIARVRAAELRVQYEFLRDE